MSGKMDEKIKRVEQWLMGEKAAPYTLEIRPTNNCNLNCLPCKARGNTEFIPSEENIPKRQYTNLIYDAARLGVKKIQITGGGEPLCKRDITFSIIKNIKKYNIEGFLVTNGTLFTGSIVKKLVKIGWDTILFSINGPNSKVDDYLRGVDGAFDRSIKTINLFAYWKKKLKKEKPELNLGPVLNSKNFNKLDEFVKLARKFSMDSIVLQPLGVKNNKTGMMLKLNEKQKGKYWHYLRKAIKFAAKNDIYIKSNTMFIKDNFKVKKGHFSLFCIKPFHFMLVDANGEVYPCPMNKPNFDKINFGNIKDKNLEDIWHGDYFNNLRRNLINGNLSGICKKFCVSQTCGRRE